MSNPTTSDEHFKTTSLSCVVMSIYRVVLWLKQCGRYRALIAIRFFRLNIAYVRSSWVLSQLQFD